MPLRSVAFLLYFVGSSGAALIWPMVGLICYVVLYHVYPQTTWWGKALEPLDLRYTFICGSCLVVGALVSAGRTRVPRPIIHPIEGTSWPCSRPCSCRWSPVRVRARRR